MADCSQRLIFLFSLWGGNIINKITWYINHKITRNNQKTGVSGVHSNPVDTDRHTTVQNVQRGKMIKVPSGKKTGDKLLQCHSVANNLFMRKNQR